MAKLDKPVEQVLIESRIVVATDDYARDLGVKFGVSGGYEDNNGNVITTSGNLNATDGMVNQALVNRFNNTGSGLPVVTPGSTPGDVARRPWEIASMSTCPRQPRPAVSALPSWVPTTCWTWS